MKKIKVSIDNLDLLKGSLFENYYLYQLKDRLVVRADLKEKRNKEKNKVIINFMDYLEFGKEIYDSYFKKGEIEKWDISVDNVIHLHGCFILKEDLDENEKNKINDFIQKLDFMEDSRYLVGYRKLKEDNTLQSNFEVLEELLKKAYLPYNSYTIKSTDDGKHIEFDFKPFADLCLFSYIACRCTDILTKKEPSKADETFLNSLFITGDVNFDEMKSKILRFLCEYMNEYEKINSQDLTGFNKMVYDKKNDRIAMERRYDNLYALIWNTLKLVIVNGNKLDNDVVFGFCKCCGEPVIGGNTLASVCDFHKTWLKNEQQRKRRKRKKQENESLCKNKKPLQDGISTTK